METLKLQAAMTNYRRIKDEIEQLEAQLKTERFIIQTEMESRNIQKFSFGELDAKLKVCTRSNWDSTKLKERLPDWEQFQNTTTFTEIKVLSSKTTLKE